MPMTYWHREERRRVREAIQENIDLDDGNEEAQVVRDYLELIARDLATVHPESEEDAFHHIIRCMADVVRSFPQAGYSHYHLGSPFSGSGSDTGATLEQAEEAPLWRWPVIHFVEPTGGEFEGDFARVSALKLFGYTVGLQGWDTKQRQKFLRDFMESDLPGIVTDLFGDAYGEAMTTTRLRKVANVIAGNASNFFRNDPDRYEIAISEWCDDLEFLRKTYYEGAGLKFEPWPTVDWDQA